jgi:hypothetical protein
MQPVPDRPHFCPWCGSPVGSFFGRFDADGAVWCEGCEEWFTAVRAAEPGTEPPGRSFGDDAEEFESGETP